MQFCEKNTDDMLKDLCESKFRRKSRFYPLAQILIQELNSNSEDRVHLGKSKNVVFIETEKCAIVMRPSASIYLGYHNCDGWVAIKRILKCGQSYPYEKHVLEENRFRKCENIIYFNFCDDKKKNFNYFVMELCDHNLKEHLALFPEISFHNRCTLAIEFLTGLTFLHEDFKITHRDLKPQNILISLTGKVKICDFGISRNISSATGDTIDQGDPFWLPPNKMAMVTRDKPNKHDDVWAALALIYYIYSGKHPFHDLSKAFVLTDYIKRVQEQSFVVTLDDSFLEKAIGKLFKIWLNSDEKEPKKNLEVSEIIEKLHETHRIKDVKLSTLSYILNSRTSCHRHAILLSYSTTSWTKQHYSEIVEKFKFLSYPDVLPAMVITEDCVSDVRSKNSVIREMDLQSGPADITVLQKALSKCDFKINARDDITKMEIVDLIDGILKDVKENKSKDVVIYLHISSHGLMFESGKETACFLKGEIVAVKEIMYIISTKLKDFNTRLIVSIDACRKNTQGCYSKNVPAINFPYVILYSVIKGEESGDTGTDPGASYVDKGAFAFAGKLCGFLSESIKPATELSDVFDNVQKLSEEDGCFFPELEVSEGNTIK